MSDIEKNNNTAKALDGQTTTADSVVPVDADGKSELHVNASGHVDSLKRQYGLLSVCGLALNIDNAWVAFGGSIVVAIGNGGPPGVIWELLTACCYYGFIAASIAELASSVPSAGGVYHWASMTPGPRYGRVIGFFTGALNFFGWIFDLASIAYIPANVVVQMYALYHPDFVILAWHPFVAFVLINVVCCTIVIFGNRFLPALQDLGLFMVVVGGIVTVIVVAAMPQQHASNAFVWTEYSENNITGWGGGVAFLTGVLNGAYTIGTPDAVTHMAEELPRPRRDLPRAVAAQIILGTLTSWLFAITIMYAITDLDAVVTSNGSFPLAAIYLQATGSTGATFGLLFIVLVSIMICVIGTYLTLHELQCGRIWWALARDNVTPFASFFSMSSTALSCPIPATIFCFILTIGFGAIQLGSKTAFNDLVGSFIILTTTSYVLAILPHLLTGRVNVPIGDFWMGRAGFFVNGITVVLIIFFNIMFCFPYVYPVTDPSLMNYNSVILVGCAFLTTCWWFIHGRTQYQGPKLPHGHREGEFYKVDTVF